MEMTREWIDNFNRKCSKFLKWKHERDEFFGVDYFIDEKGDKYALWQMVFHIKWDRIMQIVEKIESTYDDFHGYFAVYIGGNSCTIQGTNLRTTKENFHPAYFDNVVAETKKQTTVVAIDRFLDWYNKKP